MDTHPADAVPAAASGTPALNPRTRGNGVETAAGIQSATGTGAASRTLLERARNLFSPFIASLVLCALLSGISVVLVLFIRRRYHAEPRTRPEGIAWHLPLPAAGAYIIIGSLLAVMTILILTALMAMAPGNIVVTGGKVLCALCFYLCVSSFFLAYDLLHGELYPAITGMHGVLAAIAIIGFAFLMILTPERRGIALFLLIVILAVAAALPFWQNRRHPQLRSVPAAAAPGEASSRPEGDSATIVDPSIRCQDGKTPFPYPGGPASRFPDELKGNYYDVSPLGSGGFAAVFSAYRIADGEKVAVKIPISYNELTGKSFLNEIRVWETLHHPNIVNVLMVNILPVPYVEMEFLPLSLDAVGKPVPVPQAVDIIRQLADALRYAHGLGIVHRDIKSHNILLTRDLVPKITDWGMSKMLSDGEDRKSSIVGYSLEYAAPEQISPSEFGKTDSRTDIYQLGVVFYELVTGMIPFCGDSFVDTGDAILHKTAVPPSEYNTDAAVVDAVILKCLEKDPSRRFQSAAGLLNALSLVASGKLRMEYSVFPASELLAGVLAAGGYATKADIVTEVPPDLLVEADAGKITVILDTLISNAVQYSKPPRKIRVTYQSSPDDPLHHISVHDNGIGITEAQLDIIFRPSGATDTGRSPGKAGRDGVSLSLAKKYIQMHGGHISVDSVVSVGSTFTLHIPKTPVMA
jgi:serine/threonine protein kinase